MAAGQTFTDAEKTALQHLAREVEWFRKAGHIMIGFTIASVLGLSLAVSQEGLQASLLIVIPSSAAALSFVGFVSYVVGIRPLKSYIWQLLSSRLSGDFLDIFLKAVRVRKH